jgi:hypothetical protein
MFNFAYLSDQIRVEAPLEQLFEGKDHVLN